MLNESVKNHGETTNAGLPSRQSAMSIPALSYFGEWGSWRGSCGGGSTTEGAEGAEILWHVSLDEGDLIRGESIQLVNVSVDAFLRSPLVGVAIGIDILDFGDDLLD